MSMDDDLRQAVTDRLTRRSDEIRRRRDARRERLAELAERRQAGLKARHRRKLARGGADSAGGTSCGGADSAGAARREQSPPTRESREPRPACPADRTSRPPDHPTTPTPHATGAPHATGPTTGPTPDRPNGSPGEQTTRTPGHPNTAPAEQTSGTPWPPEHPPFRDWLLAHGEKRPRRSGQFLHRLARDATRCGHWNTPDELLQAMETYESGPGHGAPPMSAAERVNAAVVLYRAYVGVAPGGVDGRPVMAPVDPAGGHDNGAAG